MKNMATTDYGVISDNFEMTCREYSICRVMTDFTSPVRDKEYADKIGCFLNAYAVGRSYPGPDMAELLAGDFPEEDAATKERNVLRRRAVVDAMFTRAGYEPTGAELAAYRAKRKAEQDELWAFQAEHGKAAKA